MSILSLPFLRHDEQQEDSLGASVRSLSEAEVLPLSGEPVRARGIQSSVWGIGLALLAAGTVAGMYDVLWQIHWYFHIGDLYWAGWSLKSWWDSGMGFIHSGNWALYRHAAFRDLLEPAAGSMAVKTLLAKRKWWGVRVGPVRLLTAPLVVLALAISLGLAGTWALYFGFPDAWHHIAGGLGNAHYVVPGTAWMSRFAEPLLGIGIGLVIHRYWAPVGATLQGYPMDRSVDRWQAKVAKAGISNEEAVRLFNAGLNVLPRWTKRFVPPILRERFADAWRNNTSVKVRKSHGALITVILIVLVLLTLLGLTGHYWVGVLGHTVPYLFPGS